MSRKRKDLTGKVSGRLRFVKPLYCNRYGCMMWECLCDPELGGCGRLCEKASSSYSEGVLSCGCFTEEMTLFQRKLKNKDKEMLLEMRGRGLTLKAIGEELGVSKQRIWQLLQE